MNQDIEIMTIKVTIGGKAYDCDVHFKDGVVLRCFIEEFPTMPSDVSRLAHAMAEKELARRNLH